MGAAFPHAVVEIAHATDNLVGPSTAATIVLWLAASSVRAVREREIHVNSRFHLNDYPVYRIWLVPPLLDCIHHRRKREDPGIGEWPPGRTFFYDRCHRHSSGGNVAAGHCQCESPRWRHLFVRHWRPSRADVSGILDDAGCDLGITQHRRGA